MSVVVAALLGRGQQLYFP